MHRVGLIHLYIVDGEQYAEVIDFTAHNKVRKDRESTSKIPSPRESSGTTPGLLREYSGSTPSQVEVEVQVKDQVEVEGEVEVQDAPPPQHSEDNFDNLLNGAPSANNTHRVRATIRRLNADFAKRNEHQMPTWSRWTNQQIHEFWEASDPRKWPGEHDKKRSWIFADLLNEERQPPPKPYKSTLIQDMIDKVDREMAEIMGEQ